MRRIWVAAIAALALLPAACGSAGTSRSAPTGLSPVVKRIDALDRAYYRAHPGLLHCEVTVRVLLTESYTDMQHGGQGIPSQAITAKYGWKSAIASVYLLFYDALASYVSAHGSQGSQAVNTVTGNVYGYVLRRGRLRLVTGQLGSACLTALNAPNQPQAQAPPSPSPERPGFATALAVWKQTPMLAAADVSRYFLRAADDLRAAGGSSYAAAIRELTDLASLPETGPTSEQMAEAQADVAALDSFFGTPGLTPNG